MNRSLLLFRLGSRVLAVPAEVARQVRPRGTLTPLPGSAGTLLGLSAAGGRALPVVDLRAVLGVAAGELSPLTLTLQVKGQLLAVPTDDVLGFVDSDQRPGLDLLSEETALGLSGGQRGQLLSPEALLGAVTRRLSAT